MKKKKQLTMKYILQEIHIANIILDEIDKASGGNPEVKKEAKKNYFLAELAPLIEVYKTI
mgnify:FL=1|jgi:hypothetical protein|tara:strand:+ start:371 stop:550 length:180 start_codon:yes stop_codon:yes gene_type:complete